MAHSDACPNVAICDERRGFYGVQYHPEVNHTEHGTDMIHNFLYEVCGAQGTGPWATIRRPPSGRSGRRWAPAAFCWPSPGGVDSSVAAALLAEAIGSQLTCVFVDHGLMRLNEGDEVEAAFLQVGHQFRRVDAESRFLLKLAGVTEPEHKRKIIGEEFIRVFEQEAKKIGAVDFLAQGTIYPDVIESGAGSGRPSSRATTTWAACRTMWTSRRSSSLCGCSSRTRSARLGRELGLPEYLVSRQPFPGPGLAIRIIGDITKEKGRHPREADFIFRDEIAPGRPGKRSPTSISPSSPTPAPWASWATGDLRLHPGPAGRHHSGLHDRRLGPHPL